MKLEQRQSMKLFITEELRQGIHLLTYPIADLERYIEEKTLENPLLEFRPAADYQDFTQHLPEREVSWRDDIHEQIRWLQLDKKVAQVLPFLVDRLNERGFLSESNEDLANELYTDSDVISEARATLQLLDPLGIGCIDWQAFLLRQALETYPDDVLMHEVIQHYLTDLIDENKSFLMTKVKASAEVLQSIQDKLSQFKPFPCQGLTGSPTIYNKPDVKITNHSGQLTFSIPGIPVRLNSAYQNWNEPEGKAYLKSCQVQAKMLQRAVEQRQTTLTAIMKVLIEKQREFFLQGFSSLNPLTIHEVSEEIHMHESTVSRAVKDKVMETPVGVFPIKIAFSPGLNKKDGSMVSSAWVKDSIREMILSERKNQPFSDQAIADYLKAKSGIIISRRTVAKYRKAEKLPSSMERRRSMGH